jgi:hypothetical protein
MKTLLFMAPFVGIVAVCLYWLYTAADAPWFWLGCAAGAAMTYGFWRNLTAAKTPPEGLARLSRRLGVPLRSDWGIGEAIRPRASEGGVGPQRRAEGEYKGLRLTYADDLESSRVVLHHAAPLNLGLFCDFNLGALSELRQGRPALSKKLTVPTPGLTCYVVAREAAGRLFRDRRVQEGLTRLQQAVARLNNGAFLLDDRCVTVVSSTVDIDEQVLDAMHDLSDSLGASGLLPAHPLPLSATVSSRLVFSVLVALGMLAMLAMALFGPR